MRFKVNNMSTTFHSTLTISKSFTVKFVLCAVITALQACTTYSPSSSMVGLSSTEVVKMMGVPDREIQISDGKRLQFPRGPMGKHTYFVNFDAQDKLISWQQVLTEEKFKLIQQGMSEEEVMNLIGSSKERFGLALNRGYVWSYRYQNQLCQWFQIEFSADKTVRSTGYGTSPECKRRFSGLR